MAHEAGKGSAPRPFSVTQEEYNNRWDIIFGRDKVSKEIDAEQKKKADSSVTEVYNDERLVSKFDKLQKQEVK